MCMLDKTSNMPACCRIVRAPQGSAIFETVSEEQYTGRVVDRVVPPRGYNAASTSGLLSCEIENTQQQLPFGIGDQQVHGCLVLPAVGIVDSVTVLLPCSWLAHCSGVLPLSSKHVCMLCDFMQRDGELICPPSSPFYFVRPCWTAAMLACNHL